MTGNPLGGLFRVCTSLLICSDRDRHGGTEEAPFHAVLGIKGILLIQGLCVASVLSGSCSGTLCCVLCISPGLPLLLLGLLLHFSSANVMLVDMKTVKIRRCLLRRRRVKGFLVISAGC